MIRTAHFALKIVIVMVSVCQAVFIIAVTFDVFVEEGINYLVVRVVTFVLLGVLTYRREVLASVDFVTYSSRGEPIPP
jgi:hypothetical protein